MKKQPKSMLALLAVFPSSAVFACASCGCTLNSDWGSQGLSSTPGWSLDVRFDTLNQDQLRSGTGAISAAKAAQTNNPTTGQPAEVEKYTNNQYLTTTLDYNHGDSWGLSIVVPYINRSHSTLGTGSDGSTPGSGTAGYDSYASGMGDVRLIARYYGFSENKNFGIQYGLKLPTGQTTQLAKDGVSQVDPGLQLGTGTTDLVLGAYYFDNLSQNWDYFVQAQYQTALANAYVNGGSYKPGDSINLTGGLRYHGYESFTPTVQINARNVNTDSGTQADTYATGGRLVYLTPGAVLPVTSSFAIYTNVQLPIYQDLKGIQLAPAYIFSIGAHVTF